MLHRRVTPGRPPRALHGASAVLPRRSGAKAVMAGGFSVLAAPDATGQLALTDARAAFYNAGFEQAAALTLDLCAADDVDACELRSAALLMEIKRAIGNARDKDDAFKACD